VLARRLLGLVHVVLDAGEALEIGLDVVASLRLRDAQLVGEAEGGNAVDDAEIDRLGRRRTIGSMPSMGTPNISDAVMA
jgi:hypothetical protein